MKYMVETLSIADSTADEIREQFYTEVKRLLNTGACDPDDHSRGLLFGVALENIADNYLRGEHKSKEYRNMKRF